MWPRPETVLPTSYRPLGQRFHHSCSLQSLVLLWNCHSGSSIVICTQSQEARVRTISSHPYENVAAAISIRISDLLFTHRMPMRLTTTHTHTLTLAQNACVCVCVCVVRGIPCPVACVHNWINYCLFNPIILTNTNSPHINFLICTSGVNLFNGFVIPFACHVTLVCAKRTR